jgi:hypothetical protein
MRQRRPGLAPVLLHKAERLILPCPLQHLQHHTGSTVWILVQHAAEAVLMEMAVLSLQTQNHFTLNRTFCISLSRNLRCLVFRRGSPQVALATGISSDPQYPKPLDPNLSTAPSASAPAGQCAALSSSHCDPSKGGPGHWHQRQHCGLTLIHIPTNKWNLNTTALALVRFQIAPDLADANTTKLSAPSASPPAEQCAAWS